MENSACFRFHSSLNDFLPHSQKNSRIEYLFKESPSVKDIIEAIGIPHTEVDVIVVNEYFVDFSYHVKDKDQAEVFPLKNITLLTPNSLTPPLVGPLKFIVDVHAGKLAREMRMLGFDTTYQNNYTDHQLSDIAENENRVVLTRDVGLLRHKKIKWGYWLRSQDVDEQLPEVINQYDLKTYIGPFTRCIACNGKLEPVTKEEIQQQLPKKTLEYFNEFFECTNCKKVYWKGSHYEHMLEKVHRFV